MAWRVPRLEFSGTPLADAIPLFNQYGNVRLVLGDTDVAKVRLSGVLRADNMDTLLGLLGESYGIRVEKRSGNEIVLRRARSVSKQDSCDWRWSPLSATGWFGSEHAKARWGHRAPPSIFDFPFSDRTHEVLADRAIALA